MRKHTRRHHDSAPHGKRQRDDGRNVVRPDVAENKVSGVCPQADGDRCETESDGHGYHGDMGSGFVRPWGQLSGWLVGSHPGRLGRLTFHFRSCSLS